MVLHRTLKDLKRIGVLNRQFPNSEGFLEGFPGLFKNQLLKHDLFQPFLIEKHPLFYTEPSRIPPKREPKQV